MGFLNHSTSNIIIDAVLTERGRQLLARNDGSFVITDFSFADDEVDYSLITKYGKVTGKDKIEKNTPVMEAITNADYAVKYHLLNVSGENQSSRILYMPKIELTSPTTTPVTLSTATVTTIQTSTLITAVSRLSSTSETTVPTTVRDSQFGIIYDARFLKIVNEAGEELAGENLSSTNVNTRINYSNATIDETGKSTLNLYVRPRDVSDSLYSQYGSVSDKTVIYTQITLIGQSSQRKLIIPVTVSKNN